MTHRVLAFLFALVASFSIATIASAEQASDGSDWSPNFGWNQGGQPNDPDKIGPYPVATGSGNFVVITTGDANYTDPSGQKFNFPGKGTGESRGSVIIVVGGTPPQGTAPSFIKKYSWIGVAGLPDGKLTGYAASRVVNGQVAGMRDPKNNNGGPGQGLSGVIDVAVIDGATGLIRETRLVYPGQWAAEK